MESNTFVCMSCGKHLLAASGETLAFCSHCGAKITTLIRAVAEPPSMRNKSTTFNQPTQEVEVEGKKIDIISTELNRVNPQGEIESTIAETPNKFKSDIISLYGLIKEHADNSYLADQAKRKIDLFAKKYSNLSGSREYHRAYKKTTASILKTLNTDPEKIAVSKIRKLVVLQYLLAALLYISSLYSIGLLRHMILPSLSGNSDSLLGFFSFTFVMISFLILTKRMFFKNRVQGFFRIILRIIMVLFVTLLGWSIFQAITQAIYNGIFGDFDSFDGDQTFFFPLFIIGVFLALNFTKNLIFYVLAKTWLNRLEIDYTDTSEDVDDEE